MIKAIKKIIRRNNENINFYLYLLPWIIGFSLFTIIPMGASLFYSFHNVSFINLNNNGIFVGFRNYQIIFNDALFISSIGNTFLFSFVKTFVTLFIALLLALLINQKFKANKLVRVLIYLPAIIPTVASVMVWSQLFSKDFSLFNYLLNFVGLGPIDWYSYSNAMFSVLLMSIWVSLGPNMLILLAALQGVSKELMEASEIDGAGRITQLFKIVIPSISPTLFFLSITSVIGGLQAYAEMQLLFGVGTDNIITMAWNIVLNAFSIDGNKTMGYASAQAWVLFLIIMIFTVIYFAASKKFTHYEAGE